MSSIAIRFKESMKASAESDRMKGLLDASEAEEIRRTSEDYDKFQLVVSSMDRDLKRMSKMSHSERDKLKSSELIPKYKPIALDYLKSGSCYRNPILVEVIIMMMDIGDIPEALELALPAVEQKQPMPKRFKKANLPTFIGDNMIVWATARLARDKDIEPYFSDVFSAMTEDGWMVPREVISKFFKIAGDYALKEKRLKEALDNFITAFEIDPKASKCITKITQLKKELERA